MSFPPELLSTDLSWTNRSVLNHINVADLGLVLTFLGIIFSTVLYLVKSFQRLEQEKEIFLQRSLTSCLNSFESQQQVFTEKVKEIVKLCTARNRILNRRTELYRSLIEWLVRDLVSAGRLCEVDGMSETEGKKRQGNRRVTFNPLIDIRYISATALDKKAKSLSAMRSSIRANRLRRKRTRNSIISPILAQAKAVATKEPKSVKEQESV